MLITIIAESPRPWEGWNPSKKYVNEFLNFYLMTASNSPNGFLVFWPLAFKSDKKQTLIHFFSLLTGESAFSKSKTLPRGHIHIDEIEGKQKVQNIMQLIESNRQSIRISLIKVVKSCKRKFAKSIGIVLVFFRKFNVPLWGN